MKFIKANKHWLLLILLPISFISCDIPNSRLLLINNTNKAYYYRLLADTNDLKEGLYIYHVSARDSVRPLFARGGDGAWEYNINNYSPDSTLNIYLFDTNAVTKNIIQQQKFKKLTYKVKDLDNLNWKIIIPR